MDEVAVPAVFLSAAGSATLIPFLALPAITRSC